MIDQQMMQAGRILLSLLEPLLDAQDEILRQAGADQENSMRKKMLMIHQTVIRFGIGTYSLPLVPQNFINSEMRRLNCTKELFRE